MYKSQGSDFGVGCISKQVGGAYSGVLLTRIQTFVSASLTSRNFYTRSLQAAHLQRGGAVFLPFGELSVFEIRFFSGRDLTLNPKAKTLYACMNPHQRIEQHTHSANMCLCRFTRTNVNSALEFRVSGLF